MGNIHDLPTIPQVITPEKVNDVILAVGAARITFDGAKSIAGTINSMVETRKWNQNPPPRHRTYLKRQRELEAAHINLEKWTSLFLEIETRRLRNHPTSKRSIRVVPVLNELKSALENTRELFVKGLTKQRGQRGASVVPHFESHLIFHALKRSYRAGGSVAPKDSILYEIIRTCFEKVGILVTRDAVRKAIEKAEKQRTIEMSEFRRLRQISAADPGK